MATDTKTTAGGTAIEAAGEALTLLPERAVHWPRERMLLIADAHFGKAERFRMHGVPVPAGTTDENLQMLDRLVALHRVERLVFLGDFLHGRVAASGATLRRLVQWRAGMPALSIELVLGNHDMKAGALPAGLSMVVHSEPLTLGPLALCHHPEPVEGAYVLAGHLHPVVKLHGRGHDRVRTPCFVFGERVAVLPAFGAFTGGHRVERQAGDRIWVVAGERVLRLPG